MPTLDLARLRHQCLCAEAYLCDVEHDGAPRPVVTRARRRALLAAYRLATALERDPAPDARKEG